MYQLIYFSLALLLGHLWWAITLHFKVKKTTYYKPARKRLHYRVLWMLPYLGPLLVTIFHRNSTGPLKTTTKKDRKVKNGSKLESTYPGISSAASTSHNS
ncbi:MAG TPA: hypothetical protein DCP28_16015 [Cytophagales bacterium]|nr:hypothetical protein [Cytophagales bacterium]